VEVGQDRLYYDELGSGPAIVLLHDGLIHSAGMEPQLHALSGAYRVIRYDRRGYGKSDTPGKRYSPSADLEAILDALGVARAVLIGASAGGALAVDFTLAHPGRVSGLVLVGPIVGGYGFSEHFQRRGSRAMEPAQDGDYTAAMRNMIDDRFELAPGNDEARERLWELIEPLARKHLTNPPELRMLPEWSAAERLPEIQVPTLIVVGEADIPDVHAHAGVLEAGIAASERVVLEGAGHLVFYERPAEFNRLVLKFLECVGW
jgi:pimeloyl-ACP methyl ester carboxylesterase